MIQIRPTTASALSHSIYSLDLVGSLNLVRERAKKIQQTLDGGVAVTLWAKNDEGAQTTKEFLLNPLQYSVLYDIIYHKTCFEWLVFNDSQRFICELDLLSADKTTVAGNPDYQRVKVSFLVIEVL